MKDNFNTQAQALAAKIRVAWKDVPQPNQIAASGCPEDDEIIRLYAGRTAAEIDLTISHYEEEAPMIYMTEEAKHYFIQTYLLYCLDSNHRLDQSSACPHLIDSLISKRALKQIPSLFSSEQIQCIVGFLLLVRENQSLFGADNATQLQKAIDKWRTYAG